MEAIGSIQYKKKNLLFFHENPCNTCTLGYQLVLLTTNRKTLPYLVRGFWTGLGWSSAASPRISPVYFPYCCPDHLHVNRIRGYWGVT